ncbi:1828_t:CDS:1, partial [Gigaspora margarita]
DKVEAQVTNVYYFNTKLEWHVYSEEAKNKSFTYLYHLGERKIANHNKRKVTKSEFEPKKKWDPNNKNNYTKDKPMFDSNKENHTAGVQAG